MGFVILYGFLVNIYIEGFILTYVSLFYTQLNGNERKITYVSGINLGKSGNGWNIHSKKWLIVGKSQIHSRWSEGYIVQHIIFTQLR